MKTAYRLYSWRGILKEQINAKDIKSPADARKLSPFVDKDKYPFLWVNWSKPKINTGKKTLSYFRKHTIQTKKEAQKSIYNALYFCFSIQFLRYSLFLKVFNFFSNFIASLCVSNGVDQIKVQGSFPFVHLFWLVL